MRNGEHGYWSNILPRRFIRPPGWDSQDAGVLLESELEAARFAAIARLAFSIAIAGILFVISTATGRFNEWIAIIAIVNVAVSGLGLILARAPVLPYLLPWIGATTDALVLFGIGWFGPWLDQLPSGARSALVSPWAAFLLLAVTSLGLNAARLLYQTFLLVLAIGLLIWWPTTSASSPSSLAEKLQPLFSDGSNAARLGILLLTGLAMALAAIRSRRTLMLSIRSARERTILGRFNAAEVNRHILSSNIDNLRNGNRQRVTVLFADIRGFTHLSETLEPSNVAAILNSFRARAIKAIELNDGIIDKFIGDGLFAIFGLSSDTPHERNALNAAIMLAGVVDTWSQKRAGDGRDPIQISIGVHTGDVFLGLLGEQRIEFTAIGDAVNVAQRLQASCFNHGTSIMVSAQVFTEAIRSEEEGMDWTLRTGVQLRGRQELIDAYIYTSRG